MIFKIKFESKIALNKMIKGLEDLYICVYALNLNRNTILIEELPKSVIDLADEIGGVITLDEQYSVEKPEPFNQYESFIDKEKEITKIYGGKVYNRDGNVIGERG